MRVRGRVNKNCSKRTAARNRAESRMTHKAFPRTYPHGLWKMARRRWATKASRNVDFCPVRKTESYGPPGHGRIHRPPPLRHLDPPPRHQSPRSAPRPLGQLAPPLRRDHACGFRRADRSAPRPLAQQGEDRLFQAPVEGARPLPTAPFAAVADLGLAAAPASARLDHTAAALARSDRLRHARSLPRPASP